jgi:hypothetical protein
MGETFISNYKKENKFSCYKLKKKWNSNTNHLYDEIKSS